MVSIYDVLKASKGIHVEDSFAEIWGRKLRGGYKVKTLTGVPPFAFTADGQPLIDWSLAGQTVQSSTPSQANPVAAEGVGVRTSNLLDFNALKNATSGTIYTLGGTSYSVPHLLRLELKPNTTYASSSNYQKTETKQNIIYLGYADAQYSVNSENSPTFTTDSSGILKIGFYDNRIGSDDFLNGTAYLMLNTGSTALPYEPFGYKIPVNVQSENLFNAATVTNERITWATGATFSADDYRLSDYIPVDTTQTYTCSTSVWFVGYDANKTYLGTYNDGVWDKNGLKSVTQFVNSATLGAAYVRLLKRTISVSTIMLNRGSIPLPYQPYSRTTTNIYLGSASTTRRIKKYVFTGEENGTIYSTATSRKGIEITGITGIIGGNADTAILAICTHYQPNTRSALYRNTDNGMSNAYQNDNLIFYDASCQTVEAFQQFCAQQYANGTPVTIWYVLATPETAAVNEPLMKIGSYADELTKTGAGVDIPTVSGSNTLAVNTTVQPSEMSITFRDN